MAEVVAVANFKGGVGKSTTSVSFSAGLARLGLRCLLCDLDPQANAGEVFIPEEQIKADMRSVIVYREPIEKVIHRTRIEGLDVLPASFDLAHLDKELVVTANGTQRIERALRPVLDSYDYIVLDTGPNLSHLTLGALVAADHIVMPVAPQVWSVNGLRKFLRWIDGHRADEVVSAELLGVVATMVTPGHRVSKQLFDDLERHRTLLRPFKTWIPRRVKAEDAAFDRKVIGDAGVDISLTTSYTDLTGEIVERVGELAARRARHAAG